MTTRSFALITGAAVALSGLVVAGIYYHVHDKSTCKARVAVSELRLQTVDLWSSPPEHNYSIFTNEYVQFRRHTLNDAFSRLGAHGSLLCADEVVEGVHGVYHHRADILHIVLICQGSWINSITGQSVYAASQSEVFPLGQFFQHSFYNWGESDGSIQLRTAMVAVARDTGAKLVSMAERGPVEIVITLAEKRITMPIFVVPYFDQEVAIVLMTTAKYTPDRVDGYVEELMPFFGISSTTKHVKVLKCGGSAMQFHIAKKEDLADVTSFVKLSMNKDRQVEEDSGATLRNVLELALPSPTSDTKAPGWLNIVIDRDFSPCEVSVIASTLSDRRLWIVFHVIGAGPDLVHVDEFPNILGVSKIVGAALGGL